METNKIFELVVGCYKVSRNEQNLRNVVATLVAMARLGKMDEGLAILETDEDLTFCDICLMQQMLSNYK